MTYTEQRQARIFTEVTAEAEIGDIFAIPGVPIMTVTFKSDFGYMVAYKLQSGSHTEHWDVMKPEAELREQERSRIEEGEAEIIYDAALEEWEEALGFSLRPDCDDAWLTEPIGVSPDYIFGMTGEQMAEVLPPVENAYHSQTWSSSDCEF